MSTIMNIFPHFKHIVNRKCTPSWSISTQVIKFYSLLLVYDGEAVFCRNGTETRAMRGDLLFYRKGDTRKAYTFPDKLLKCYAVDFIYTCPVPDSDISSEWQLETNDLPFNFKESIGNNDLFIKLCMLFEDLSNAWLHRNYYNDMEIRALFLQILYLLMKNINSSRSNYAKTLKVDKLIHYMTENMKKQIQLKDLCNVANMGPSYLNSIFNEVTGMSPIDYLINIRINKAKYLLMEGYSVTDAAYETGFKDVYYFSKYFKKHEGLNPSEFKSSNFI